MSELRDAILAILNYPGETSRLREAVGSILYNRLVAAIDADLAESLQGAIEGRLEETEGISEPFKP